MRESQCMFCGEGLTTNLEWHNGGHEKCAEEAQAYWEAQPDLQLQAIDDLLPPDAGAYARLYSDLTKGV